MNSAFLNIFLRYLLLPLLIIIGLLIMSVVKKAKSTLNNKRLIIFILLLGLFLAIPIVFLGFLGNIFYPWGVLSTHLYYIVFGFCLAWFTRTSWFESIGFNNNIFVFTFSLLVSLIIGTWLYFIIFERLNDLPYHFLMAFSCFWMLVPLFINAAEEFFIKIPTKVYKLWYPENYRDHDLWETMDLRKTKDVKIMLRRTPEDQRYPGLTVKIPMNVTVGQWFNRFVEDHDVKFPDTPIELSKEGELYGWVFYKQSLLPIIYRPIDFEKKTADLKLKDNQVIMARRVLEVTGTELQ